MIEVKNRAPQNAGRVKLTEVSAGIYDMERADGATEKGTPLNADTAEKMQGDIRVLPAKEGETIAALSAVDFDETGVYINLKAEEADQILIENALRSEAVSIVRLNENTLAAMCPATNGVGAVAFLTSDGKKVLCSAALDCYYGALGHGFIRLNDTTVIYLSHGWAQACIYNEANKSVTKSAVKWISSSSASAGQYANDLIRLSDTQFLSVFNRGSVLMASVCTLSGTVINRGADYSIINQRPIGYTHAAMLANGKVLVTWCGQTGGMYSCVLTITGETVSGGAVQTLDNSTLVVNTLLAPSGADGAVALYYRGSALYASYFAVSGETVSIKSNAVIVSGALSQNSYQLKKLNDTYYLATYQKTGETEVIACLLKKAGNSISVCDMYVAASSAITGMDILTHSEKNLSLYYYKSAGVFYQTDLMREKDCIGGLFYNGSSMALSLSDGENGENIKFILSGSAKASGIKRGETIATDGIWGDSPKDDFVSIYSPGSKAFVSGSYIGNGAAERAIALGFEPSAVLVYPAVSAAASETAAKGGLALKKAPLLAGSEIALQTNAHGFFVYCSEAAKTNNAETYYYIAYR